MSSDYIRALNAVDVWSILDDLHARRDIRKADDTGSAVTELLNYGYAQAVDDFGRALHELSEFLVVKAALENNAD